MRTKVSSFFSASSVATFFVAVFSALILTSFSTRAAEPHRDWSFRDVGLIPVQSGGRVKPLDSFAREAVLFETGSRSFEGWDPVDLALSWIAVPAEWEDKNFVQLSREDVRRELGIDEKRTRFSPGELFKNSALLQYAEHMPGSNAGVPGAVTQTPPKPGPREQELRRVLDRLGLFRNIVSGDAWLLIPKPAPAAWQGLSGTDKDGDYIRGQFVELLRAYKSEDKPAFDHAVLLLRAAIAGNVSGWTDSSERVLEAESLYNRTRPFLWAWILYLCSALVWGTALNLEGKKSKRTAFAGQLLLVSAFLVHVGGIAVRCYIAGRPPVTNMYESIMWVSLGVVIFGGIIYAVQRQAITLIVAATLACFGLIAGDAAPAMMDPGIHPLVPVLRSNYWLTIHVLTITLGYAAFALTLGLANVTLFQFAKQSIRRASLPSYSLTSRISGLNQLTYRAMQFGVVLLAAGTILGGVWADYSWGRFWGWDPKEVWALIALLSYLVILHGRFTGWVGQFAYAAWTVVAFLSVVMAWYGVNFILGVGLHSYGFSTGGRAWVAAFVGSQLVYVGFVMLMHKTSLLRMVMGKRMA